MLSSTNGGMENDCSSCYALLQNAFLAHMSLLEALNMTKYNCRR